MKRLKDRKIPRFSERSIRNLVGSEGGLQEASDRLGHASLATTKRYYRLKPTVVLHCPPTKTRESHRYRWETLRNLKLSGRYVVE